MTTSRRRTIEDLCRSFLSRQNVIIEETREIYKSMLRPLVPDSQPSTDIANFIEGVGDELFNSRPADMAYICIFLEFVCEIYDKVDDVNMDQLTILAANVIERTNFESESKSLFRDIISGFLNILSVLLNVLK